jgi:hypothetical protein
MTLTFTIKGLEESLSAIEQYKGAASPEEVAASMKDGVERSITEHFTALNNSRANKLGGTRTNYWAQVGKDSITTVTGSSISVTFPTVGFRRHVMGGPPIRPTGRISVVTNKPIKFLTIPVNAAAHGQTVASLKASKGVELYRVGGALKKQQGPTRSESDPTYFVLAKQTKAKAPDPTLLPKDEVFIRAAEEALTELEMAIKEGM